MHSQHKDSWPIGSVDSALNAHDGLHATITVLSVHELATSSIYEVHDVVSVVGAQCRIHSSRDRITR